MLLTESELTVVLIRVPSDAAFPSPKNTSIRGLPNAMRLELFDPLQRERMVCVLAAMNGLRILLQLDSCI